jgi:hypothetical protein
MFIFPQERSQQHWSLKLSLSIDAGGLGYQEAQTAAFILDQALVVYQGSSLHLGSQQVRYVGVLVMYP